MATTAYKFNPGFQSDDEAIESFVVRQRELAIITGELHKAPTLGFENPHLLITAPRGAGKTTLCRRVVAEIRSSPTLSERWQPLFLGEESYTVTTPGEFFLECVFHLQDEVRSSEWKTRYEELRRIKDDDELARRSARVLDDYAQYQDKQLLLVVENLHMLLSDQIGVAAREKFFRFLVDSRHLKLLATSVVGIADDSMQAAPAGFINIKLEPLSLQECQVLWVALTAQNVKEDRVRPLQILTGGSPRLLHILADFTKDASLKNLLDKISYLIDQNTEYFKSQLDSLPSLERKVFVSLLDQWDPSSAKDVAEASRVDVNTASAMLSRLHARGAVIKEPGTGRAIIYYAAERLFNIYYLMRRRNRPSSRVRALVSFMTLYYDRDELVDTTAKLALEACQIAPEQRGDYHVAFSEILSSTPEPLKARILARAPEEFLKTCPIQLRTIGATSEPPHSSDNGLALIDEAWESQDLREVLRLAEATYSERPGNWDVLWRLAVARLSNQDSEGAVEAARLALEIDPQDAGTRTVLALGLLQLGSEADAKEALEEALKVDPKSDLALLQLANLEYKSGNFQAARKMFKKVAPRGSLGDEAASGMAKALRGLDKTAEAEVSLKRTIERHPEWRQARSSLLDILQEAGRASEGFEILHSAVEHLERWEDWADLGLFILHTGGSAVEAESALREAIARDAAEPSVYWHLARAIELQGVSRAQLPAIATAMLDKGRHCAETWLAAGDIYRMGGELALAENAYRTGVETYDDRICWIRLVRLLGRDPNRVEDARRILQQALTQHGGKACILARELGQMLIHQGADNAAEHALQEALSHNERCYCCIVLRAQIAERKGKVVEAESLFNLALSFDPKGVAALTGLAHLVEPDRAAELIKRAVETAPNDPRCLIARARLREIEPEAAEEDLRLALQGKSDLPDARLYLASLQADVGNVESALDNFEHSLSQLPTHRELIPLVVDTTVKLVKAAGPRRLLDLLLASDAAPYIEPLIVAARIANGETVWVAKEVMEVAKDILDRIQVDDDERLLL